MLFSCHFQILLTISEIQLTLHKVHTVKSAVSLKWQVGFENDMKITPIFTITFSSKMLIKQCFTSLEHTFLDDGLNSLLVIYYGMYLNFEAFKGIEKIEKVEIFLVFPNSICTLNQKNLWPTLIYLFEHLYHCSGTPYPPTYFQIFLRPC